MDESEALDLDSLLELMDGDDMGEITQETQPIENPVVDHVPSTSSRAKDLKSEFEKALIPQKVVNPKENETPHDEYPAYKNSSLIHSKELKGDSDDEELSEFGRKVQKELKLLNQNGGERGRREKQITSTWKSNSKQRNVSESNQSASSNYVDAYSGIRIVNPLIPFDVMQQRMQGRRMIKMSFMKNFIKNGDIEGDWVTVGVVVGKLPPKQTKTGRSYSIWKMTDLHDPEKILSVFLFSSAHTEHWKTTVGTVIGMLNPKVSVEKELSLSIDHPGKLMLMGTSKDLGHCKSKRKDGSACNNVVNMAQCEYCLFHVKHEYQKYSGKRSELQAYTGKEPDLKHRLLKKQNIIYGGQMFISNEKKPAKANKTKDKLTLSNLTLKRKAEAVESEVRESGVKKLAELYGPEISKKVENNSEFINSRLALPSPGSRNLLKHLMKDNTKGEESISVSLKDLKKMRENQFNARAQVKKDNLILQNLTPQIGKGLGPGQKVSLDAHLKTIYRPVDLAKLKAIKKIKEQGQLKAKNPNSVKVSENAADKVKAVLDRSFNEEKESNEKDAKDESTVVHSKLGSIDLNSDRVKELLNRKSSHAYEVEMADMEKEAAYFDTLEKKERMEEKMSSTTEMVCDVVSCKKCKYTAHSAAERCIKESHPLKCHKAVKRFFACKDCKWRTCSFKRYPSKTCRGCKGSNFERSSIHKARSGPKLDTEVLHIRGDECKHLNSLSSETF